MKWVCGFFLISFSLFASHKAVVFDFGNVMASPDPDRVVNFLCQTFELEKEEFQKINEEKRIAVKKGETEENFWFHFGKKKGISLPDHWPALFQKEMKLSLGVDDAMYSLVSELKEKKIQVGMLSNIWESLAKRVRVHGLYEPFEPCLLSYEMGVEKPDPKAYQILLDTLYFPPQEIVFIDDLQENIDAAKKAGLDAILFESAAQIREELSQRKLL